MTNLFAAIDLFNISLVWVGIVLGVAVVLAVLMLALRCHVIYLDSEEGNAEIHREKHPWLKRVGVHSANKPGKRLLGWSTRPGGEKPLMKQKIIVFHNVRLYSIWEKIPVAAPASAPAAVAEPVKEIDYTDGIIVKFNYVDTQSDEIIASEGFRLNTVVPEEEVAGWGFAPNGKVLFKDGDDNYVFAINLYPVIVLEDSDVVVSDERFDGETIVDISYNLSSIDKVIYKESHYVKLKLPNDYNENKRFLGWSVVPDGDVVVERGEIDSVFSIPLYSVEEVVVEEPVVEEPVVEEPAPLYEEVVEEYIPAPVVEEPVVEIPEEPVVEEPAVVEEPVQEAEPVLVPTYYDNEGNKIDIKYSRSFTANLIQSDDTVKDYYSELKNHILSYKGVKSRFSWKFDSYNRGRDQLFKVKLRGKTICLYCALDPNEFDESKYHHEAIDAKIFADVPMLVKIKSGLGLRKAKELVDITMAKFGIEKDEKAKTVDYVAKYPYEPNEPLLARKLIKALIADDAVVVMSSKPKEEVVEPIVEPVVEEPVVIEEPVVEEPVVAEEPVVEEPQVEEEIVIEAPAIEPELVIESVSAEEAHHIVEEKHIDVSMEEGVDYITAKDNKKAIVNIDTLSKNYRAGEDVTIQSMKDKKLIDKKAKCVKVLARGVLDKPLKIRAGEFSQTAIEMILLTGGHAMHVVYKIKK